MLELAAEEAWRSCRRRRKGRKENAWTFLSENAIFQFYVLNSARETFEDIQLFESFNNVTSSDKMVPYLVVKCSHARTQRNAQFLFRVSAHPRNRTSQALLWFRGFTWYRKFSQ